MRDDVPGLQGEGPQSQAAPTRASLPPTHSRSPAPLTTVLGSPLQDVLQEKNDALQAGGTVEVRTGFVLDEGSETGADKGFELWLEHSGAGGDGIPVGNGVVRVKHFTLYAAKDADCTNHYNAARTLLDVHEVGRVWWGEGADHMGLTRPVATPQIGFAIIQTHTCKTNLSATYHDAGVVHFLQSGTNMVDQGNPYSNKHSWCAPLD